MYVSMWVKPQGVASTGNTIENKTLSKKKMNFPCHLFTVQVSKFKEKTPVIIKVHESQYSDVGNNISIIHLSWITSSYSWRDRNIFPWLRYRSFSNVGDSKICFFYGKWIPLAREVIFFKLCKNYPVKLK